MVSWIIDTDHIDEGAEMTRKAFGADGLDLTQADAALNGLGAPTEARAVPADPFKTALRQIKAEVGIASVASADLRQKGFGWAADNLENAWRICQDVLDEPATPR